MRWTTSGRGKVACLAAAITMTATAGCCKSKDKDGSSSAPSGPPPTTAQGWIARADTVSACEKVPGENYAVSMQARTAFDTMVDMMANKGLRDKQWVTYSCSGSKVGFFAYEYDSKENAASAAGIISALIWGPDGRTPQHPERIAQKANVLLVVSSKATCPIDKVL